MARLAGPRDHIVVNVDALTFASCLKNLSCVEIEPSYFFEKVDICNRKKLDAIFEKYSQDAVMQLAAESQVDRSIQ